MSDVRIQARVIIREVLSERTYHAALPNGKVILAYSLPRDAMPTLAVNDESNVLLSLCDFSEGRLVPDDLTALRIHRQIIKSE